MVIVDTKLLVVVKMCVQIGKSFPRQGRGCLMNALLKSSKSLYSSANRSSVTKHAVFTWNKISILFPSQEHKADPYILQTHSKVLCRRNGQA
jgi:hypothetical protein